LPSIGEPQGAVTGGVDTHSENHVAGVVDQVGRVLGGEIFAVTAAGYRAALRWMRTHGRLEKVGVEGTGGYGSRPGPISEQPGCGGGRGHRAQPASPAPTG